MNEQNIKYAKLLFLFFIKIKFFSTINIYMKRIQHIK